MVLLLKSWSILSFLALNLFVGLFVYGYPCNPSGTFDCAVAGVTAPLILNAANHTLENCVWLRCPTVSAINGTTLTLRNATFVNSILSAGYSGIFSVRDSRIHMSDTLFSAINVRASVVWVSASEAVLQNVTVNNVTTIVNGAFRLLSSTARINGLLCSNATVQGDGLGGCLFVNQGTLECNHCVFRGCKAQVGAAVTIRNARADFNNSRWQENIGYSYNGVINFRLGASGGIRNSVIERNKEGGLTAEDRASVTLNGVRIEENLHFPSVFATTNATLRIDSCLFKDNSAFNAGGITMYEASASISNTRFIKNRSVGYFTAGAVYTLGPGEISIENITMVDNESTTVGAMVIGEAMAASFAGSLNFSHNRANPHIFGDDTFFGPHTGGFQLGIDILFNTFETFELDMSTVFSSAAGSHMNGSMFFQQEAVAKMVSAYYNASQFPSLRLMSNFPDRLMLASNESVMAIAVDEPDKTLDPIRLRIVDAFGNVVVSSLGMIRLEIVEDTTETAELAGFFRKTLKNGRVEFKDLRLSAQGLGTVTIRPRMRFFFPVTDVPTILVTITSAS